MIVLRDRTLTLCAASALLVAAGCRSLPWSSAETAAVDPATLPFPVREPAAPAAADARPETDDLAADLRRGHHEAEAGRLDQAARYYERALRDDPRNAVAHHRLGVIADERGDFAAAERHYVAALSRRPDDADILNDLGYSYVLQDRPADAERTLRAALAASPRHERGLMNLALLYHRNGDDARALAVLRGFGSDDEARTRLAMLGPGDADGTVRTASAERGCPVAPPLLTPERRDADGSDLGAPSGTSPAGLPAWFLASDDPAADPTSPPRSPQARRGLIRPDAVADLGPPTGAEVRPAASADPSRRVVTANIETGIADPLDDVPLWTPSARAAGYRPTPNASVPSTLGSPSPDGPAYVQAAAEMPTRPAAGPGLEMFPLLNDDPTPPLPPPVYGSPGSNAAIGGGRYPAPPEYRPSMTAPPRPQASLMPSRYRVGHAAPPLDGSGDEYADDLASQDAEMATLRGGLHAERMMPSGYDAESLRTSRYRTAPSPSW